MKSYNDPQSKHILSFGGGVNSVALLVFMIKEKKPLDEVVFADTGGEVPETYEYSKLIQSYLEEKGIPFRILKSKSGTLYDTCKRRMVTPSEIWRWCTRDKKIIPIYSYYRSLGTHINQYLGIAYEERDRARESGVSYATNIYPLIEKKIDREQCLKLIHDAGLKNPIRSGCYFCPFNSISRWTEIYRNHKPLYEKAIALEENSKHFPKQKLMKLTLRVLEEKIQNHETIPQIKLRKPCGSECVI